MLPHVCETGLLALPLWLQRLGQMHYNMGLSFGNLACLNGSISGAPPHGFKISPAKVGFDLRWKALCLLLVSYPFKQAQNTFLDDDLFYRPSGNKPQLQSLDPDTNFSRKLRKTGLSLLMIKPAEKSGSNVRCEPAH